MAALLIEHGSVVDKADNIGDTPIYSAAWVRFDFDLLKFKFIFSAFLGDLIVKSKSQRGDLEMVCILLRAGANPGLGSGQFGTARGNAERNGHVQVVLAIDRHKCRNLLVELCIGLHAVDFPVLVVLEIDDALCASTALHEAKIGEEEEWQLLDEEGHLRESVSWEIAKKVKHQLD